MKITIQKAKNGEETAAVEGHFLHSNYAPVKEAQRFVENLKLPYTPSSIIITEPGLSYAADFLRERFPELKIGVIRYSKDFEAYNSKFDFVLNYFETVNFESYLENKLNEEELLTAFFVSWPASAQIFKEEENICWASIKAAMERAKTLLITRQYFEKKWFLNSCRFLSSIKNPLVLEQNINRDCIIISSGPSLLPFIDIIKENQEKFFIICLSSAISVCLKNKIKPDLCMTTDGGYWAGQHLKALYKADIALAMPAEGYCPKALLSKVNILPLDYGDGLSNKLTSAAKLSAKKAVRNGTVSGTALLFAANYCSGNIYLCGMDMANQTGYQHAQPNQLEYNSSLKDNRLFTKALRLTKSELTNGSLDIYKDWFINNPLKLGERKVFRLMEKENSKNNLGWIQDLDKKTFNDFIPEGLNQKNISFIKEDYTPDKEAVRKMLSDKSNCLEWQKQLFPLDFVQLCHNPMNKEIENKINKEWEEVKNRAEKILL